MQTNHLRAGGQRMGQVSCAHGRLLRWVPLVAALWMGALNPSYSAPFSGTSRPVTQARPTPSTDGVAEARLLAVYRQIANANHRDALRRAEKLVSDYPHFQLAQLVYGDLLSTQTRPLQAVGDVPLIWRGLVPRI